MIDKLQRGKAGTLLGLASSYPPKAMTNHPAGGHTRVYDRVDLARQYLEHAIRLFSVNDGTDNWPHVVALATFAAQYLSDRIRASGGQTFLADVHAEATAQLGVEASLREWKEHAVGIDTLLRHGNRDSEGDEVHVRAEDIQKLLLSTISDYHTVAGGATEPMAHWARTYVQSEPMQKFLARMRNPEVMNEAKKRSAARLSAVVARSRKSKARR